MSEDYFFDGLRGLRKGRPQERGFWDKLSKGTSASQAPWHIVVWEEDLAKARQVLADSGLQEG